MTDAEQVKADIAATRAELVETANALAAKLDPKTQARHKLQELYDAAPEPVRTAWNRGVEIARPLLVKIAADPKRAALIGSGALAGIIVLRRTKR